MLMVFGVDRNHTGTGEEDISQANFYGGGRGGGVRRYLGRNPFISNNEKHILINNTILWQILFEYIF